MQRDFGGLTPELEGTRSIRPKRLPDGAVFLSACRACEVEPEYRQDTESYGLLTRFLVQVLQEQDHISQLSYQRLRQAIVARYGQDRSVILSPTPQLEGGRETLEQTVLGAGAEADRRPFWPVTCDGANRTRARLAAGALQGVTVGSLYELYARPEDVLLSAQPDSRTPSQSLAWIRIEQVEGATATGALFRWLDTAQTEPIEAAMPRDFRQGFAVERYHEHGDFGLRLRVVRAKDETSDGPPLQPDDPDVPLVIRRSLADIRRPDESQWLHWVTGDAPCDVLLRIAGNQAALFPATGVPEVSERASEPSSGVAAALDGGWGPIDLNYPAQAGSMLQEYLRRITRARNLIRLASAQNAEGAFAHPCRSGAASRHAVRLQSGNRHLQGDCQFRALASGCRAGVGLAGWPPVRIACQPSRI